MEIVDYLLARKKAGGGSDVTIEQLNVTENGTYSEEGIAYSPVVVNVPAPANSYQLKNLPSGTVSTIDDGTDLPMSSLKVGIEPVQDLHGYDHPWVGGAGKNKCDAQNPIVLSQADNIGNQPCVIPAGTYTYSWTSSENTAISLTLWNDSTQIGSFASTTALQGRGNLTFTISENATHLRCYYNGATTVSDIQVEEGSTATSYEPYSNICPISGWTEANVSVRGVNVWDEEWENGSYDDGSGEKVPNNSYIRSKNAINVVPSTTYCATRPDGGLWLGFYDINGVYLSKINTAGGVFTTPNNAYYLRLHTYGSYGTTYNHDISINYSSTDTEYHAYSGQTYTIQFKDGDNPLTVYGGTLDVTTGELTVTDAHIASYDAETLPSTWISDRDVYAEGATPTTGAEVVYKLANSVTYHLIPTQVRTLVGNNNIWADTGDVLSGKYFKEL